MSDFTACVGIYWADKEHYLCMCVARYTGIAPLVERTGLQVNQNQLPLLADQDDINVNRYVTPQPALACDVTSLRSCLSS
jgi:hypothetical protein